MNATDIAQALKHLDWTGVPIGNKAIIQQAITALEQASLQYPGEAVGYVTPEVAGGSKDWEQSTLLDAPEGVSTEPLYAGPVTAASAVAIARIEAHAKGLGEALHACLDRVNEYEAREWAGDASGARACVHVIETLIRELPDERDEAVSLSELAQRVIEYGNAREERDANAVQTTYHAILAALPGAAAMRDAGGQTVSADGQALRELVARIRSATYSQEPLTLGAEEVGVLERCAGLLVEPVTEPEFTDWGRAALVWVLYHNQDRRSPIGRAIRFALGMGESQPLNAVQVGEALRWAQSTHTPAARGAQVFDTKGFYVALNAVREQRDVQWKQVTNESGVTSTQLTRLAMGRRLEDEPTRRLAHWANLRLADFDGSVAIPEEIQRDLERTDWTPETALRWYAAGKHFDSVAGRTRILDTGAVASIALKRSDAAYHALKGADASFPAPYAAHDGERVALTFAEWRCTYADEISDEQAARGAWDAVQRAADARGGVPSLQQISDYLDGLDAVRREVVEREARELAARGASVAPTISARGEENRAIYVSADNLRLFDAGLYSMFDVGVETPNRMTRLYREAALPGAAGAARKVTLWEAFEMGFSFRSALLGHVLDGRDVGRLTTCEFWAEPMLGMHEGTDLHVGLTVGQAVVRLKTEVRRRLDALEAASNGCVTTPSTKTITAMQPD